MANLGKQILQNDSSINFSFITITYELIPSNDTLPPAN